MAGLFDKQAEIYLDARPTYPGEWYSKLAVLTPHHIVSELKSDQYDMVLELRELIPSQPIPFGPVAEHYEKVVGIDVSEDQLKLGRPHPRIRYLYTPESITDDELVAMIGGENSVDLVTVAQAVHWFDLPKFYSNVTRLLRKPGGVIAVWGYNQIVTLPFPFESVGLGSEGKPILLDIPKKLSFEGFLKLVRSWSAVTTAKDQAVDLLSDGVVKEFEHAWGGPGLVRSVVYKVFMIAGKVKL
ncbi:hypothetical protein I3842_03G114600 [Carya illinoinensis]|uniref:Methyltransferase type 11 domain-containing protein n=1 Tax=Carya illinoinensis TaxID=32201 RepID=A0A922FG78_CARIL|nr:hypothetical protein I3842_03G114600 [Carya illinoinensis]